MKFLTFLSVFSMKCKYFYCLLLIFIALAKLQHELPIDQPLANFGKYLVDLTFDKNESYYCLLLHKGT